MQRLQRPELSFRIGVDLVSLMSKKSEGSAKKRPELDFHCLGKTLQPKTSKWNWQKSNNFLTLYLSRQIFDV